MTKVCIDPQVLDRFPTVNVLAFRATGLPATTSRLRPTDLLVAAAAAAQKTYPTNEALGLAQVVLEWRDAYRAMDVKPNKFRPSFEALARRAIAAKPLTTDIPMVDLYNSMSLKHQACLGAYDADRLGTGPITLRLAHVLEDRFEPLGGRPEDFPLRSSLVVYAQGSNILCWGFNCRDSSTSALQMATQQALFFAESLSDEQHERASAAMTELREMLGSQGATVSELLQANSSVPFFVLQD